MIQTEDVAPTIERLVTNAFPDNTAPGAAVLVAKRGQVLYRQGMGLANLEHKISLEPGMLFPLASLTKPFTSTAILMLVESGQLVLTDPLSHLLPEFPMGETTITPEHLLTHTSGIAEYTELPEWWAIYRQDISVGQLIDLFKAVPRLFVPGTRWAYCNSGYILLGAIIEQITGKSYEEFLAERIFLPLEMSSTFYEEPVSPNIPRMVTGYSEAPDGYVPAERFNFTHFYSAGGLKSTLDDLARWFTALYAGNLIVPDTLRRMWTPYVLADGRSTNYGYGWWVSEYRGRRVAEHYGSLPGYANYLLALPDDDILIAILSNDDGRLNRIERLAIEIITTILGEPYQPPTISPMSTRELTRFVGTYLNADGMTLTLALEKGQLILQTSLGEHFKLLPKSPWEFFFPEIPESRLIFVGNENLVSGLEWVPRRGMPVQARKTS